MLALVVTLESDKAEIEAPCCIVLAMGLIRTKLFYRPVWTYMPTDHQETKFKALPVQVIETDDGIVLKRGCTQVRMRGKGLRRALRVVLSVTAKGPATHQEICAAFAPHDRPAAAHLIDQLIASRLLVPEDTITVSDSGCETSFDVFCWQYGDTASTLIEQLNRHRLAIIGVNSISNRLVESLYTIGVENVEIIDDPLLRNLRLFDEVGRLRTDRWPSTIKLLDYDEWINARKLTAHCIIATSDFGGLRTMREWNRVSVDAGCRFFPVLLQDMIGYIGPLVVPGETACVECLYSRQNSHIDKEERAQRDAEKGDEAFLGQFAVAFHPAMASILADLAAVELTKLYSDRLPKPKIGTLIEVDMLSTKLSARKVLKIPHCSVCSASNRISSVTAYKTTVASVQSK